MRPIQAKDISDDGFLMAVAEAGADNPAHWAMSWDVARILSMPDKVVLAKARKMIRRGVIRGCACGCRGNWVATDEIVA